MPQVRSFDLVNNLGGGVSIEPGTNFDDSADIEGDWVDCQELEGPVQALCDVASATGSPTSFSVNFELWEADDSSGTNAQKVATQQEVTLTADKTFGFLHGLTTKPFCQARVVIADSSFTGGTTPAIDLGATVLAQKKSF